MWKRIKGFDERQITRLTVTREQRSRLERMSFVKAFHKPCDLVPWGLFLESPETFRAYFGWHNSLCIFKTKAFRGTKLCSYFCFSSLYNIWKDQLYRISRSYFYKCLFGLEKFSGLSRNGPQGPLLPVLSRSRGREVVSVMSRVLSDWAVARFQFGRWNSSNKCIAQKGKKWAIKKTDWRRRHHLPLLVARTFSSTSYSWTTKQTIQKLILSMCALLSTPFSLFETSIWGLF